MRIVQQAKGLRVGGFMDVYEDQISLDQEQAIDIITGHFADYPTEYIGRAYDGAFTFRRSKWREFAIYYSPGSLRIEDRVCCPVWLRLLGGRPPTEIEQLSQKLKS